MNDQRKSEVKNKIPFIITAVLLVALISLICTLVAVILSGSSKRGEFDIDMIKPSGGERTDITDVFIPQFIGVTAAGKRGGVAYSENIITDLYRTAAPTVSYVLAEGDAEEGSAEEWNSYAELDNSVFIRFHTQLPDIVVGMFSDMMTDSLYRRDLNRSYIYEMFIVPYSEALDEAVISTRSADGKVTVYTVKDPKTFISAGEIETLMKVYSNSLDRFEFAVGNFDLIMDTEPVFLTSVRADNVIMTNTTARMIFDYPAQLDKLLAVFAMNPDKATETVSENESSVSYVDSCGVLYIHDSSFEFRATTDGGITIRDITSLPPGAVIGLEEYIRATDIIFGRIREIGNNYTGGEARTILSSVTSSKGVVTVELMYSFGNITFEGINPAIRTVFENESLREAEVCTLSVLKTDKKSTVMSEWGFASHIQKRGISPRSIGMVYRTDFSSLSVKPEWSAKISAQ